MWDWRHIKTRVLPSEKRPRFTKKSTPETPFVTYIYVEYRRGATGAVTHVLCSLTTDTFIYLLL